MDSQIVCNLPFGTHETCWKRITGACRIFPVVHISHDQVSPDTSRRFDVKCYLGFIDIRGVFFRTIPLLDIESIK